MSLCLGTRISELKASESNVELSGEVKGRPWWTELKQQHCVSVSFLTCLWIIFHHRQW